jgi:formylmethanofuran dehydrogenase subunit E
MTPPSIGVTKAISSFVRDAVKKGDEVDQSFIKIAPFYLNEWRDLDYFKIKEAMVSSNLEWTKEEFSAYFELSEMIKIGTKLKIRVKCDSCGEGEVTAPIYFPSGFRSLFVISDIFRELF